MIPLITMLLMSLVWVPFAQSQTIFEHARDQTIMDTSYVSTPDYVRGRVNFRPLLPPPSSTVFRGQFQTGGFCNFNAVASITNIVETLPDMILQWLPMIALGVGVSFACKTFPSECDLVKDLKNFANLMLRFQTASCEQVVQRAMFDGVASRNDAVGACFREAPPNEPSNLTWERCMNNPGGIPLPNGGRAQTVPIIATLLETAGVDPATATRIEGYTGRFVLRAQGSIFSSTKESPQEPALVRLAELVDERVEDVAIVIDELQAGITPAPGDLQRISAPGLPVPLEALRRIADEPDPDVRAEKVAQIASALGYAQLRWDMSQDLGTFQRALNVANLPPSQREVAAQAETSFRQEIERFERMKSVLEEHVGPVFRQLLEERAGQLSEANAATVGAGPNTTTANRYGQQSAFGYTQ